MAKATTAGNNRERNNNRNNDRERAEDIRVYKESLRYVQNAKRLLDKAGMIDQEDYRDRKYVRLAGHALHHGMLLSLDRIYRKAGLPGMPQPYRKLHAYYLFHADQLDEAFADKRPNDHRLRRDIQKAYYFNHLVLGYDGIGTKHVVALALRYTLRVIKRLAPRAVRIPKVEQPKAFPVAKRPAAPAPRVFV